MDFDDRVKKLLADMEDDAYYARWGKLFGIDRRPGESLSEFRKRLTDKFKKVNDGIQSETER